MPKPQEPQMYELKLDFVQSTKSQPSPDGEVLLIERSDDVNVHAIKVKIMKKHMLSAVNAATDEIIDTLLELQRSGG